MPFEDRNIRANPAYLHEVVEMGARATPVTVIEKEDGRRVVVVGFDRARLTAELGLS